MKPEELGKLLIEYDSKYVDCYHGCPFHSACERVSRLYDADADPCTAFATLLKILNEGEL